MGSVFNHVGHCVTDLARSRRFYEKLLGFRFQREIRPSDDPSAKLMQLPAPLGMTACYLERDGFVLELLHFAGAGGAPLPRRDRPMNEPGLTQDRKSTRLNSSHPSISYAVFCLKKKKKTKMSSFER